MVRRPNYGKRGKLKTPPFVSTPWELLNSSAYKGLPTSAAKLLPFVLGKPKLDWRNPDRLRAEFEYSVTEAMRDGRFARATAFKAIKDLHEFGFIDVAKRGVAFEDCRLASKFRLSDRWRAYGGKGFMVINWKETPKEIPGV